MSNVSHNRHCGSGSLSLMSSEPENRRPRVVIVGEYPQDPARIAGGAESVVLYLARGLHARDG